MDGRAKLWIALVFGVSAIALVLLMAVNDMISRPNFVLALISGVLFCGIVTWGLRVSKPQTKRDSEIRVPR